MPSQEPRQWVRGGHADILDSVYFTLILDLQKFSQNFPMESGMRQR